MDNIRNNYSLTVLYSPLFKSNPQLETFKKWSAAHFTPVWFHTQIFWRSILVVVCHLDPVIFLPGRAGWNEQPQFLFQRAKNKQLILKWLSVRQNDRYMLCLIYTFPHFHPPTCPLKLLERWNYGITLTGHIFTNENMLKISILYSPLLKYKKSHVWKYN